MDVKQKATRQGNHGIHRARVCMREDGSKDPFMGGKRKVNRRSYIYRGAVDHQMFSFNSTTEPRPVDYT